MPDLNVVLNIATLLVLVGGTALGVLLGPRAFKAKQAEKDLAEKDRTIATHEQSITALETAAEICNRELVALRQRAEDATEKARVKSEIAAGFQARYEEQSKYTAKEAFKTLERVLSEHGVESERRHVEVLRMLDGMSELLGERRDAYRVDPASGGPDRP